MKKKLLALGLAAVLVFGLGAYGCKKGGGKGKSENMILFSVFNGGFGTDWAQHAATEFNKTSEKYQVKIVPNEEEWYSVKASFEAGTSEYDIYLNSADVVEASARGWLEDISDVYSSKPDGEDGKTVYEKVKARDREYVDSVHKKDGKYYSVPFQDGFMGFVYDHDVFLDNGFLIGEDGNCITSRSQTLSKGRDGVAGTFDDGHPSNIDEYKKMLNKIQGKGMPAYLWTGLLSYYISPLYSAIFAEYDGMDAYKMSFSLNGTYTNPETGVQTQITKENGYETYKMQGRFEALNFMDTYMADPLYYHPDSVKNTTNTDVQRTYIYGNAYNNDNYKPSAFLYEGIWWENEARANFNSLASRGRTDYAYGNRDYRYMMLPLMDEYQQENGYVLPSFDAMSLFVKKQSDSEKTEVIKRFLSYIHSDTEMRYYTSTTGGVKPFDYTLTETDLASMSKFAKSSYNLYNSDSVQIARTTVDKYGYRDYYDMDLDMTTTVINGVSRPHPIQLMVRGSGITTIADAKTIFDSAYNYYSSQWSALLGRLS